MMHDIFVPCRIGNYYLHTKRVLSVEVSPVLIQAILIVYSGKNISIDQTIRVPLKDGSEQTQISAIKKIISTVGAVDEIVTTVATSAIIFKELELPFLGRDSLKMVIPFEVENILPFALEDAFIDFLITYEDTEKKISTVLVAAVRKQDIHDQHDIFIKAEIPLQILTVDVFALYRLYDIGLRDHIKEAKIVTTPKVSLTHKIMAWRKKMYDVILRREPAQETVHPETVLHNFQPTRSEVLIDIGWNSLKVLYIKDGILHAVRIAPFSISDGLERMSQNMAVSYHDLVSDILAGQNIEKNDAFLSEVRYMFDEISRTLLYFEQLEGASYLKPYKIIVSGYFSNMDLFVQQAKNYFGSILEIISVQSILEKLKIRSKMQDHLVSEQAVMIAAGLWVHHDSDSNLLQEIALKQDFKVLHMQLIAMFLASTICLGGIWLRSSQELQKWQTSYNSSKRQFSQVIEQSMGIDLQGEKNLKSIVTTTEETLKREKALWFSFTKQHETSILEYLQDLSIAIDRVSIGLDLRQMHIDAEKVTMTGSVKSFETLDVFDEELQELKLLTLVEKPRELSWTIQLHPKNVDKE